MQKFLVITGIALVTVFTVVGDSFLKKANDHFNKFTNADFLIGFLVYAATAFIWVYIYRVAKFSISGVIYSILSMFVFVVVGIFMFNEKLSVIELLGVGLGIASILILGRFI